MAYYIGVCEDVLPDGISYFRDLFRGKGVLVLVIRVQGDDEQGTLANHCRKRILAWAERAEKTAIEKLPGSLQCILKELEQELEQYENSMQRKGRSNNPVYLRDMTGCICKGRDCLVWGRGAGIVGIVDRSMEQVRISENFLGAERREMVGNFADRENAVKEKEMLWRMELWRLETEVGLLFGIVSMENCGARFLHPGHIFNRIQLQKALEQAGVPEGTIYLVYKEEYAGFK